MPSARNCTGTSSFIKYMKNLSRTNTNLTEKPEDALNMVNKYKLFSWHLKIYLKKYIPRSPMDMLQCNTIVYVYVYIHIHTLALSWL
jgi:hypothetical protein